MKTKAEITKEFLKGRKLTDLTPEEQAELDKLLVDASDYKSDGDNSKDGGSEDDKTGKDSKEGKEDKTKEGSGDALSGDDGSSKSKAKEGVSEGTDDSGSEGQEEKPGVETTPKTAVPVIEEGYLNDDCTINTDKVHDESVVKAMNDLVLQIRSLIIDNALNAAVKDQKLAVGVDTIKRLLDMTKITIAKDKVLGIKDALDALRVSEPVLFKAMTSNPINEPFNPVKKDLTIAGAITPQEAWESKEGANYAN